MIGERTWKQRIRLVVDLVTVPPKREEKMAGVAVSWQPQYAMFRGVLSGTAGFLSVGIMVRVMVAQDQQYLGSNTSVLNPNPEPAGATVLSPGVYPLLVPSNAGITPRNPEQRLNIAAVEVILMVIRCCHVHE